MDLLALRSRVQERLDSSTLPYTVIQIDTVLNEGQQLFALLTLCVERSVEIRPGADTPIWNMLGRVDDWIVPLRVRCKVIETADGSVWDLPLWDESLWDELPDVETTITQVRPARLADLDARDPDWQTARDSTIEKYGCQGLDQFYIYPSPGDTNTSLLITYAGHPYTMSNDGDAPEIPEEYQPALISYALCTLPLRFGGAELARFAAEWDAFVLAVQECGEWMRARSQAQQYDTAPTEISFADRSREKRKERAA